jgi:hypothetical protein
VSQTKSDCKLTWERSKTKGFIIEEKDFENYFTVPAKAFVCARAKTLEKQSTASIFTPEVSRGGFEPYRVQAAFDLTNIFLTKRAVTGRITLQKGKENRIFCFSC